MSCRLTPVRSLAAPSPEAVGAFLREQAAGKFGYTAVGATRGAGPLPAGYAHDHNRALLGRGAADFAAACAALRGWRMFPAPWTRLAPAGAPWRVGETLAMQAHVFGLWWMNACRIVYVLEAGGPEPDGVRRCGFAYGTLAAHVEEGEERFSVEQRADGSVWYDLRAFSRPRYWPVRLAKPLARRLQRRFVRDSQRAMRGAVEAART